VLGLAREREPLEDRLAILRVEHDDLVPLAVAREVAEHGARAQVVGRAPHALQARAEVLADELLPGRALHAAPAPVQLEQDVGVEVVVDLVELDLELAPAPPRRGRDRRVGARGRAHGAVGRVAQLGLGPLLAQAHGGVAGLGDQRLARLAVDELVHLGQALEGVLAVEDAALVDGVVLAPVRVQGAQSEVAVDRRAADQHREAQLLLVELLDAHRHLLGRGDEQRAEADRGGVVLLGRVDDRPDRNLLAEVDDRVAVVGEDRVDQ
jgi:hypothetical protein